MEDILDEARAIHDESNVESVLKETMNFKSSILLLIEENLIQIIPPPTISPNHEANLWVVIERLNSMGANVDIEELHFIEGLEDIMDQIQINIILCYVLQNDFNKKDSHDYIIVVQNLNFILLRFPLTNLMDSS